MAQSNQGQAPSSRAPSPPPAQGSTPGGPDAPTPVAENWCYTQVRISWFNTLCNYKRRRFRLEENKLPTKLMQAWNTEEGKAL